MENLNILKEMNKHLNNINTAVEYLEMLPANEEGFIEAISDFVVTTGNKISNVLSDVSNSFANILAFKFNKEAYNGYLVDLIKFKNRFKKYSQKVSFTSIQNRKLPVMIGMKTNLQSVANYLENHTPVLNTNLKNSVNELNSLVSKLLSDDETAASRLPDVVNTKNLEKIIEMIEKDTKKLIDPESYNDRIKIGDLVPSLMSISSLIETGISVSKNIDLENLNSIKEDIAIVNDRVTLLVEQIKEKRKKISKERLKELTAQLRVSANHITVAMTVFYVYTQYVSMLLAIERAIKEKM